MRNITLLVLFCVLLAGCACRTGQYKADGSCCASLCDKECSYGYKEGTCKCECLLTTENSSGSGVSGTFEDPSGVTPPPIPS